MCSCGRGREGTWGFCCTVWVGTLLPHVHRHVPGRLTLASSPLLPSTESDLAVNEGLETAIAEVMAWNETVSASSSSGSHSLQAQISTAVGLAAAAAGVLLLV